MSGVSPAPEALPDIQHHHLAHARAVAGTLVKASRLPPLVSEFKQTIVAFHDESFQGNPPQWFEHNVPCLTCKQHPSWNFVPGPAKLLKFVADSSNGGNLKMLQKLPKMIRMVSLQVMRLSPKNLQWKPKNSFLIRMVSLQVM